MPLSHCVSFPPASVYVLCSCLLSIWRLVLSAKSLDFYICSSSFSQHFLQFSSICVHASQSQQLYIASQTAFEAYTLLGSNTGMPSLDTYCSLHTVELRCMGSPYSRPSGYCCCCMLPALSAQSTRKPNCHRCVCNSFMGLRKWPSRKSQPLLKAKQWLPVKVAKYHDPKCE